MNSPNLDIFKEDSAGHPIWVDAVGDLENARRRLSQLASVVPGDYFVFDQKTRQILVRLGSEQIECT